MNIYDKSDNRMIKVLADSLCPLKCEYCSIDFNRNWSGMTSGVDFIINNIEIKDTDTISFMGDGEPLYSRNLENVKRLVKYVRSKSSKCLIMLTTNGVCFTDETMRFIFDNKIRVNVSCDIRGFEQRKFISGRPTLNVVIENLKKLSSLYNIHPMVNLVVNDKNISYLEEMLLELNSIGIKKVTLGVEMEYLKTKDRHILVRTKKTDEFYNSVDIIASNIKSKTGMRFIHRVGSDFRVKINEQAYISWNKLLNYHEKDNTMVYTSLKCREDDAKIYGNLSEINDFNNYEFYINGQLNKNVMAYDVFLLDRFARIRMADLSLINDEILFSCKFKGQNIISFRGHFNKFIYDASFDLYYLYIDNISDMVV